MMLYIAQCNLKHYIFHHLIQLHVRNPPLGTGMPTLTPNIAARNRLVNHSALAPLSVYTHAALPYGLLFSMNIASSQVST